MTDQPAIPDAAISDYDDGETTGRVIAIRDGLQGWPLRQAEVRAGLAAAHRYLAAQALRDAADDHSEVCVCGGYWEHEPCPAEARLRQRVDDLERGTP